MHTTVDQGIVPGPIQAVGTFLYQLDNTPGRMASNLWGGGLQTHNCNEPRHVEKAVKLILAAQDLLSVAKSIARWPLHTIPNNDGPCRCSQCALINEAKAAIAKADQE